MATAVSSSYLSIEPALGPIASQMSEADLKTLSEHLPQEIIDIATKSNIAYEVVYQTSQAYPILSSPKIIFEVEKFGGVNVHVHQVNPKFTSSIPCTIPWKNGHCTHDAYQYHRGLSNLSPETTDAIYTSCFRDNLENIHDLRQTYLQFFERAIKNHVNSGAVAQPSA